jgi:hypothetical protein
VTPALRRCPSIPDAGHGPARSSLRSPMLSLTDPAGEVGSAGRAPDLLLVVLSS